uniref:Zf-AD domain-containing protein n=1 Tax=Anopheles funestus TaxID=62324 RepID=A0A4Y0BM06_ANOFN
MSGPSSMQYTKTNDMSTAPVILLNGLPVKTTYMANCRLCLGTNFGDKSTTIVDERFGVMLSNIFPFPIPNQIGLPMNVCSKCRKGVELFFRYSNKVRMNQKKLEETFIPIDCEQTANIGSVPPGRFQQVVPDTNRVQEVSNIVEITSDDEFQKETNDDKLLDVDMQCEPVTDSGQFNHDPLLQPSSYDATQMHFVAVPDLAKKLVCSEIPKRNKKRSKKSVAQAPLVIEIISLSDEEGEESAQTDRKGKQKQYATQNQHPPVKAQTSGRTSSQTKPSTSTVHNINNVDKAIDSLASSVTMVYYEADINEGMDEATTSTLVEKDVKTAPTSKRNMRSTVKESNAKRKTQELKNVRRSR